MNSHYSKNLMQADTNQAASFSQRIRLTLAYVGTRYHGWQLQKGAATIQGTLEEKLTLLCGMPVRIHASGRTDAGVHATGQVAHFDAPAGKNIPWQKALNSMLPQDIAVLAAEPVAADFHARFSVVSKRYIYTIWTQPTYVLPQRAPFVWAARGLDLPAMDLAAAQLCGTHDFAAFQNAGTDVTSSVRTLEAIQRHPGAYAGEWNFYFQADGFLKQMVRNLMGLLVKVGQGALDSADARRILESRDRRQAPGTAPAQGLCLSEVIYSESTPSNNASD